MTPTRKLILGGLVITMTTTCLAYMGASSSWQFYMTVDEFMRPSSTYRDTRVRLSGKVGVDSLRIASDQTSATFILEGTQQQLHVECRGPLPDNLREGCDVVVEGRTTSSGLFKGDKVLTRCASKYDASSR